jgi:hypothetical protein
MATAESNLFRESIRTALAQRVGVPDSKATANATAATWRLLGAQLAPVIGARGLEVLFDRAFRMTSATFPWLAVGGGSGAASGAGLLPGVAERLACQRPAEAAEASYTLFVTFTELLTNLIGESLTARLLTPVWAGPSMPSVKESVL